MLCSAIGPNVLPTVIQCTGEAGGLVAPCANGGGCCAGGFGGCAGGSAIGSAKLFVTVAARRSPAVSENPPFCSEKACWFPCEEIV